MMKSKKPWATKLRPEQEPKIDSDRRGRMLVPTPMLVAKQLRKVPTGRLVTPAQLRDRLARNAGADLCCPMTTGIFLSIIAGATEEALAEGRPAVAPYWRVVLPNGALPPKFPPGPRVQAKRLRAEGHRIAGGRVVDVAEKLIGRS